MVEPTPDMVRLQRKLIDVLASFMSPTGTDAASAKTQSAPVVNQAKRSIISVPACCPLSSIHVFGGRIFAYQFGNFGTAARLLHPFKLTQ